MTAPTLAQATDSATDLCTLVLSARSGDDTAWATLVRSYQPLLLSIARAHDLSPAEAADAAQATWERFVRNIDRLNSPEAVVSWLATTTRRECYAVARRRSRERPTESFDAHEQTAQRNPENGLTGDPLDHVTAQHDRRVRRDCLHAAVRQLPTAQARLMKLLLSEEDLSYAEISVRLRMPIGSIGPVRRRALDRLRNSLETQIG